jgi:hypothetical protein
LGIVHTTPQNSNVPSPTTYIPGYFTPVPLTLVSSWGIVNLSTGNQVGNALNIDPWIFDGSVWTQLAHLSVAVSDPAKASYTFYFPIGLTVPAGHTLFWWITAQTARISGGIALTAGFA